MSSSVASNGSSSSPSRSSCQNDKAFDFYIPSSDDNSMKAIHQRKFMQLAYGIDLNVVKNEKQLEDLLSLQEESNLSLTAEEKKKCIGVTGTLGPSKRLTPAKWRRRVHALKYWKTGDGKFKNAKQFQLAYSDCKNLTYGARLQEVHENAEGIDLLYKVKLNKKTLVLEKKRVVHILETFDIIYNHHVSSSHHLSDTTKLKIDSAGFYNITRAEVEAFCDTCPICNLKREGSKAQQGAKAHIQSGSFRWLWQLDLVDYREDPQIGHNGVTYKWLLNIKDHFTRFCILRPLPSKEAKHVASELFFISNLLGYPMVIQTDNGNEFKGEVHLLIEELQQRDEKAIFLTTGQPRTPRHQGSVERSNGSIKKSIAKDVQHKRMLVEDPQEKKKISWLTEYPRSMASANSSLKSRRLFDDTPYFSLFGMPFQDPIFAHINAERFKRKCNVANRANLLGHDYKKRMALLHREGFHDGTQLNLEDDVDFLGDDDDLEETTTRVAMNDLEATKSNSENIGFAASNQGDVKTSVPSPTSLHIPTTTLKQVTKSMKNDMFSLSSDDDEEQDRKPKATSPSPILSWRFVHFPEGEFCSPISSPPPVASKMKVKLEPEKISLLPPATKPKEGEIYGDFTGSRSTKVSLGVAYAKAPSQLFRNIRNISHTLPGSTKKKNTDHKCTLLELFCEKCNMCEDKPSGSAAGKSLSTITDNFSATGSEDSIVCQVHLPIGAGVTRKVSLLDEEYYKLCADTHRWFESDFVSSFAVLCSHYIHNPHMYVMVSSLNSREQIGKDQVFKSKLKESVKNILCVANESGHFAVLQINLGHKHVTVYDGYNVTNCTSKIWTGHAMKLLQRLNLLSLSASGLEDFTMNVNDSIFRQTDGSSCGPIACGVLWYRLSGGAFVPADFSEAELRKEIVRQYKYWIDLMEDELFLVRTVGPKMAGLYTEIDLFSSPNDKQKQSQSASIPEESPQCISPPFIKREPLESSPRTNKLLQEAKRERISIKENSDENAKKRQKHQGDQMEKRYLDYTSSITIGTVVQVVINPTERSRCNPLNILAIVFAKFWRGSSFRCVTEFGILGYGNAKNKKELWLAADKLILFKRGDHIALSPALENIRKQVLEGKFLPEHVPIVSMKKAHELSFGVMASGATTCRCKSKKKKCSSCICSKNNRMCHSGCACNGNCCNPRNVVR